MNSSTHPSERPPLAFDQIASGRSFVISRVFDEHHMTVFEELSADHSEVHVSAEAMRDYGFPDRLMYGFLVLGMISGLVGANFHHAVCAAVSVDFANPAFPGDQVELRATVDQVQESMRSAVLRLRFTRGDSLIARGKLTIRFLARPAVAQPTRL
jgi:acyl dehydratase